MAARTEIPIVVLNPDPPYNPVSGASAVILKRSDSSTATVYQGETGGSVKTQPLTTDAAGRLDGWLARGAYLARISIPGSPAYDEPLDSAPASDGGIDLTWLGFDVATQAELNTHTALTTSAHGGIVASDDSRLTDQRVPTDLSVSDGKVAAGAAIKGSKLDTGNGRLVQKTGLAAGTTNSFVTVTSTSYIDVVGAAAAAFTPDVAATAIVETAFHFKVSAGDTGGNVNQGITGTLVVNGSAQTPIARAYVERGAGSSAQATVEVTAFQVYHVALSASTSYTLKLQVKRDASGGGGGPDGAFYWGTNTRLVYQLVAQ